MDTLEENMIEEFDVRIHQQEDEIDPDQERDWFDLAYGFFLGKGVDAERAFELAWELQSRNLL